jgi:hypothetical protein
MVIEILSFVNPKAYMAMPLIPMPLLIVTNITRQLSQGSIHSTDEGKGPENEE